MDVIGSDPFSKALAERLEARHVPIERRRFPDGEVCPRITGKLSDNVLIAERMSLPLDPNTYLAEILLTVKNLKYMKVGNISLVMPYFIYSRQDRTFRPGEPFSAKHVLDMLADAGVSRFFTVSSHMERFKGMLTAPMPAHNIDGYSIIGEHLRGLGLRNPVVMGPDMSVNMAVQKVASMLDCRSCCVSKHRDIDTGRLSSSGVDVELSGSDVVIVDDIISSGKTMLNAVRSAKSCGCGRIVLAAVHAVNGSGIESLRKHAWRIFSTDTVNSPISEVSVIERLAESIKWASGEPVTQEMETKKPDGGAVSDAFSWFG
ncbi:MAG: hypothetical protein DRO99_03310 [Candidatus Aenigmatarchaeota archaeon]|nr:MAG: hypothetical protein DRO99_03310 [Candidatus Aenigmarchaeota archaeon]